MNKTKPLVGIIMGSDSDLKLMIEAQKVLIELDVPSEIGIKSAHRTPERMREYAMSAHSRGLKVIIAGAGGAAHLPGMTSAYTSLPVIGVPVKTSALGGYDSLLSIVQMPPGIPVATSAIDGARNAGILAARILATSDPALYQRLESARKKLARLVEENDNKLTVMGAEGYLEEMKKSQK